jgi:hypothetical protein
MTKPITLDTKEKTSRRLCVLISDTLYNKLVSVSKHTGYTIGAIVRRELNKIFLKRG